MNRGILIIATLALGACNATPENSQDTRSVNEQDTGSVNEQEDLQATQASINERLAKGDITVCAAPEIEAFIAEKVREDVPVPTAMTRQPDGRFNFPEYELYDQADWDAAVQAVNVKLGAATADGFKRTINELRCSADLQVGNRSIVVNYMVRPGLREEDNFLLTGLDAGQALFLESMVSASAKAALGPPRPQPTPVNDTNEESSGSNVDESAEIG